jgi:zinc protease
VHELRRIQDEGVPDAELERTKRQLHAQTVYSLEGVTNQAFALGFMDLVASDPAAWETFPAALQEITSDDLQRVAKTYLVNDQRTVGWFVPTGSE